MKGLKDILGDSRSVSRFGRDVKIGGIVSSHWRSIFGQLSDTLHYSHIKSGVVYVVAENPIWSTEITRYKEGFLGKLNQCLSHQRYTIRNIVIKVGSSQTHLHKVKSSYSSQCMQSSLEDKIKQEIQRRQSLGYKLCTQCGTVWDNNSVCTLCRVSQQEVK